MVPGARGQHVGELVHRVPDVGEADIERRHAEAHCVGGAEVGDDPARDQGLDDGVAFGMTDADMAAAFGAVCWRAALRAR